MRFAPSLIGCHRVNADCSEFEEPTNQRLPLELSDGSKDFASLTLSDRIVDAFCDGQCFPFAVQSVLSVAGEAVNIPCAVALPFQCVALCVVAVPFADVAFALLLRFVCGRICCGGYRNYCGRQSLRASTRDLSAFRAFVEQKGAIDETNDEDTQYGAESVHTSQMAAARMDARVF
jgi:hypothetical protein